MNTMITMFQLALTALFAVAGSTKLALPYGRFVELPSQDWATDFRPGHIRLIGALEVGAAVASAASLTLASAKGLGVTASAAMALVMAGAMSTHLRRGEYPNILGNAMWLTAALLVAGARYHNLVA